MWSCKYLFHILVGEKVESAIKLKTFPLRKFDPCMTLNLLENSIKYVTMTLEAPSPIRISIYDQKVNSANFFRLGCFYGSSKLSRSRTY